MDQIKEGLLPLPKDNRDFKAEKILGTIAELPEEDFIVAEPLEIKDQYDTDMCTAFASCAVSEDQEGVILSPEYFFAQIKKQMGNWRGWGADLRSVCKVAVKAGFLEEKDNPYQLEDRGRNFVANWTNWNPVLDAKARSHRKSSFLRVGGYKNRFDSFRGALWQNKGAKCSILTGVTWQKEWTSAENGIIPKDPGNPLFGHALKIFGQKKINDELYLVAQLSNNKTIGSEGIFYFPREVINREFIFGGYFFYDINPEDAKKLSWSWVRRLWEFIKKFL